MKETKKLYEYPAVNVFNVEVRRCIALSCGNESYSTDAGGYEENGNEDLVIDNGAW